MLLLGGTVSLPTYRDMIPALAEHHTVYAVDLPGNGYTTVNDPNFSYDLAAMTDALCQFMAAVGLEDGACVVASSPPPKRPRCMISYRTRLRTLPGAGHFAYEHDPAAVDTELSTFLTGSR